MTLDDPVSTDTVCVHTHGRHHEKPTAEMFSKIIFWVTLLYLQTLCLGLPENTRKESTSTTPSSVPAVILSRNESSLVFLDIPQHTVTPLGASVLLACRTAEPVIDCQWSWRPLPPIHLPHPDINNSEEINETTTIIATVPTTAETQSLPVKLFPAFGYWTCAARKSSDGDFVSTEPARITISTDKNETAIKFVKSEDAEEVAVGSSGQIICRTERPVKECQWSWRLFNQTDVWNLEIKKFISFGPDNTDCSIKFTNVLPEQEGLWTCGARSNLNGTFALAHPIRFFISEVKFVQLSSGIQIAAGESAQLKCLVNKPAVQCEWSWKPINSSREPTVIKKITPNSDNDHDCSVRFKKVLYEEEGLWTCGVRLTSKGPLHEAPPAKLTLLPEKINLVETPQNNTLLINTKEVLKCTVSGRAEKCSWLWRPLNGDAKATIVREFAGMGSGEKECSLDIPQVRIQDQGYWACRVSVTSTNTVVTSPFAKVVVYEQDEIEFSELSKDIQISSGGSVLLKCVTSLSVEQCRWSLTPVNSNTTVVVKQFFAAGPEGRDCSVRLSHALAEQEGLWTCGAKIRGNENYTYAAPAKLSLLEQGMWGKLHITNCSRLILEDDIATHTVVGDFVQIMEHSEPVAVAVWTSPHQKVTLACRLSPMPLNAKCQWHHQSNDRINRNETLRKRQDMRMNYTSGMCTLQFKPDASDVGSWTCRFYIDTGEGFIELGNATVMVIQTEPADGILGWIVGAVTTLILFVMILVVVLVVWKGKLFNRKPRVLETVSFDHPNNLRLRSTESRESRPKNESRSTDEVILGVNPSYYESLRQYHSPISRSYENFATT
ncbi:uncharacterized protein [Fopius arisanus]|uniref:Uncharacterized protein isoform X2 n=1 Tax=Fopius arisanus TaxID=64838 RepID=A0A9R1TYH3_9HYME|nr:PREDICTED: uncharacterized protein LOC105265048 isoform X2 [Fopius arisanus]